MVQRVIIGECGEYIVVLVGVALLVGLNKLGPEIVAELNQSELSCLRKWSLNDGKSDCWARSG